MNLLRLTDARYSIIRETLVGKRFPTEYFVYISFENSTLLLLSSYRSIQRERIRDFQTRLELFRFESIASVHTCIRRQKFFSNVAGRGGNGINLARSISSLLARSLKTFFLVEGEGGGDRYADALLARYTAQRHRFVGFRISVLRVARRRDARRRRAFL